MLRVNCGGYIHELWTLEVRYKKFLYCYPLGNLLLNLFAKLGIQIRYILVLTGEMVKSGVKVAQKLQIVSDQNHILRCAH